MRSTETAREFRRRRGIELMREGLPTPLIAKVLDVTRYSLYRWRNQARVGEGQRYKHIPGRPRKLTDDQLHELECLLSQGATAHGWLNNLWTAKRVAEIIEKHFRVKYAPNHVCRILTDYLKWTPQRPTMQVKERDDADILRWTTEDYPRIVERARIRHAYLVFVDESGFMLAPTFRRSFAPCGQPPVIKSAGPHERISVIGAMTISPEHRHFGFQFYLLNDNANFHGDSVIPFIDQIRRSIRSPITFLWDRIRIHSAQSVDAYLVRHRMIVIEPFPPGAPELNPVDKVWGYVKYDRLPNYTPPDLAELRNRLKAVFSEIQERPHLLRALFERTGLSVERRQSSCISTKEVNRAH